MHADERVAFPSDTCPVRAVAVNTMTNGVGVATNSMASTSGFPENPSTWVACVPLDRRHNPVCRSSI
jgi:hypothetical protein